MKRILILVLAFLSVGIVSAQQVPQFSQNMFNKLANNPGFAGSRGGIATSVLHRSQYMGFGEGGSAISTQNFSIDAAIPFINGGVGLNIEKDEIAQFSNLGLQASYAYRTELGIGELGLGMSVGMYQSGVNGADFNPAQSGDNAIPLNTVQGSNLDLGAGAYFNTQDVYIGISSAHMSEPVVDWSDGKQYALKRHYFLIAGYAYKMNSELSLNPSIYLKNAPGVSQLDVNANLIYTNQNNNKMWGGVSYRLDEGLILLAGMDITQNFNFGVGYDVTMVNPLGNSFEVMLGYNFTIERSNAISKYKNPRFL